MTFVIVGLAGGNAWTQRKQRRGSSQRLNLAFFIHRQYQRFVRRVEIQTHHVPHLVHKLRIAREFERFHAVRLPMMLLPDALHAHVRKSLSFGHCAGRPMRRRGGRAVQCPFHNGLNLFGREDFLAPRARGIPQQSPNAFLSKMFAPQQNGGTAGLQLPGNGVVGPPLAGQKNDPRPQSDLLGVLPEATRAFRRLR